MTVILKLRYRGRPLKHRQSALSTSSAFNTFLLGVKPEHRPLYHFVNAHRVCKLPIHLIESYGPLRSN